MIKDLLKKLKVRFFMLIQDSWNLLGAPVSCYFGHAENESPDFYLLIP